MISELKYQYTICEHDPTYGQNKIVLNHEHIPSSQFQRSPAYRVRQQSETVKLRHRNLRLEIRSRERLLGTPNRQLLQRLVLSADSGRGAHHAHELQEGQGKNAPDQNGHYRLVVAVLFRDSNAEEDEEGADIRGDEEEVGVRKAGFDAADAFDDSSEACEISVDVHFVSGAVGDQFHHGFSVFFYSVAQS